MVASMCALLRDTTTASRQALHVAATLVRRFVGLEVALPEHQEFHQLVRALKQTLPCLTHLIH